MDTPVDLKKTVDVKTIFGFLEELAPLRLAEDYDNPGFLAGDAAAPVSRALLVLDITPEAVREAEKTGAQLLISHHPVIFKPVRAVLARGKTAALWELARRNVAAVCMHTNLDAAPGGVNDALAAALGLQNAEPFGSALSEPYKKIVVFVPKTHARAVREALAAAGAGHLGAYDGCAFASSGTGYFRPLPGAKPFLGRPGEPEEADEVRVEALCAPELLPRTVAAMLAAHPYEMPAYDVFDDAAVQKVYGMGRVADLGRELPLAEFAAGVKRALRASCVRAVDSGRPVRRAAVCGGAVDSAIVSAAAAAGADTLVTGECKHSLYYEARAQNLNVVEAGHFATETVVLPVLREKLAAKFPGVEFGVAACNREPYFTV